VWGGQSSQLGERGEQESTGCRDTGLVGKPNADEAIASIREYSWIRDRVPATSK
jgi:hypothetical protein